MDSTELIDGEWMWYNNESIRCLSFPSAYA